MANLTAVLRKTIDGLPNANPPLRAKVYEKARAAITRQIQAADPPLAEHVVEQRYRVLEDAIAECEAHYQVLETPAAPASPSSVSPEPAPAEAPAPPRLEPEPVPAATRAPEADPAVPPAPPFPRATPTMRPPAQAATYQPPATAPSAPRVPPETPAEPPRAAPAMPPRAERPTNLPVERPLAPRAEPKPAVPVAPRAAGVPPRDEASEVGVVGPVPTDPLPGAIPPAERRQPAQPPATERAARNLLRPASPVPVAAEGRAAAPSPGAMLSGIPEADLGAPRYPAPRASARKRSPLLAGVAVVGLVGLGALGWVYLDDIRSVLLGSPQTASVPVGAGQSTDIGENAAPAAGTEPATAAPPSGTPSDVAPGTPTTTPPPVGGRRFTQRLLADGTEVDEGPGASPPNAFEEGTNVAAATISAPPEEPAAAATPAAPSATPAPQAPANPPAAASAAVPVGQRAVFYEERSAEREGTQQNGNVVWSLVNEPPADGQPVEPAIRAVVDVPDNNLRMTMTIRRNADTTLPASHVIEIMFDTPAGFPGGAIENVQRLALKPTEQARGEPLIGVAGKISDGFFIIALNDLPQAIQSNLALLGREEWIDIPIAYASGQRALMSVEKGIPGERVFREAIAAWNGRT